jgi:hypothetical protein
MLAKFILDAKLIQDGNNYRVYSQYSGRYLAPTIKAKLDGEHINPVSLIGKRVMTHHVVAKNRSGFDQHYLLLYAKKSNLDDISGLPEYLFVARQCKQCHSKFALHIVSGVPDIDVSCTSSGSGTHSTRCISGVVSLEYCKEYKSGDTEIEKIQGASCATESGRKKNAAEAANTAYNSSTTPAGN